MKSARDTGWLNKMGYGWRGVYRENGAVIPDEKHQAKSGPRDPLQEAAEEFDRKWKTYDGIKIIRMLYSLSTDELQKLSAEDIEKLKSGEFLASDEVREALEKRLNVTVPKTELDLDLIVRSGIVPADKPMPEKLTIFYFTRKSSEYKNLDSAQ